VLFDRPISAWLFRPDLHSSLRRLAGPLTTQASANAQVLEGVAVAVVVLLVTRDRWLALACLVVPPAVDGATAVAKAMVNRTRGSDPATATTDYFPSGHTAGISVRMAMLVLVVWVVSNHWAARWATVAAAVLVSLAFAGSTAVAGSHYPTDAVGGLLFGASLGTLLTAAILRFREMKQTPGL
jgi:undecaprenyl-diphosphatase